MAQLQSTNIAGTLTVNGIAVGGGKDFKYCCFTGSTTWIPTSDLVDGNGFVEAHIVGGGGGGGAFGGYVIGNLFLGPISDGGGEGAAGTFRSSLVNITATDSCTVTIGAKGDFGYISGSWSNHTEAVLSIACSESVQKGSDGGNTTFGGITSYGGCGGYSFACATKGHCTGCSCADLANCDAGVTTLAGGYGGFRNSFENGTGGVGVSIGSGSNECLYNSTGAISKIGVQGMDLFKRCSTGPNCSSDSNCTAVAAAPNICCSFCFCRNASHYSTTFGNGGGTNCFRGHSGGSIPTKFQMDGISSGSDGDGGIVVIRWQE